MEKSNNRNSNEKKAVFYTELKIDDKDFIKKVLKECEEKIDYYANLICKNYVEAIDIIELIVELDYYLSKKKFFLEYESKFWK